MIDSLQMASNTIEQQLSNIRWSINVLTLEESERILHAYEIFGCHEIKFDRQDLHRVCTALECYLDAWNFFMKERSEFPVLAESVGLCKEAVRDQIRKDVSQVDGIFGEVNPRKALQDFRESRSDSLQVDFG